MFGLLVLSTIAIIVTLVWLKVGWDQIAPARTTGWSSGSEDDAAFLLKARFWTATGFGATAVAAILGFDHYGGFEAELRPPGSSLAAEAQTAVPVVETKQGSGWLSLTWGEAFRRHRINVTISLIVLAGVWGVTMLWIGDAVAADQAQHCWGCRQPPGTGLIDIVWAFGVSGAVLLAFTAVFLHSKYFGSWSSTAPFRPDKFGKISINDGIITTSLRQDPYATSRVNATDAYPQFRRDIDQGSVVGVDYVLIDNWHQDFDLRVELDSGVEYVLASRLTKTQATELALGLRRHLKITTGGPEAAQHKITEVEITYAVSASDSDSFDLLYVSSSGDRFRVGRHLTEPAAVELAAALRKQLDRSELDSTDSNNDQRIVRELEHAVNLARKGEIIGMDAPKVQDP